MASLESLIAKELYGVWWTQRSTPTVVNANSRNEARALARDKAKAGYGMMGTTRPLSEKSKELARKGRWVRERADGREAGDPGAKKSRYRHWLNKELEDALAKKGKGKSAARKSPARRDPAKAPVDGDKDGKVFDGTPRERPAGRNAKWLEQQLGSMTFTNAAGQKIKVPARADIGPGTVKPGKRVWDGKQIAGPSIGRGKAGEKFAADGEEDATHWMRANLSPTAIILKQPGGASNFPFDHAYYVKGKGVFLVETKTGSATNSDSAQQWRVTVNENSPPPGSSLTAAEWRAKPLSYRKPINEQRLKDAMERKRAAHEAVAKELRKRGVLGKGEDVFMQTLGIVRDPTTKRMDYHVMDGIHQRVGWKSPAARTAYRGSATVVRKDDLADILAAMKADQDAWEKALPAVTKEMADAIEAMVKKARGPALKLRVEKSDGDKRYFAGWASVVTLGDEPVVDRQGHVISADEMTAAAHDFVRKHRVGKVSHKGNADQLEFVESVVLTKDVQEAMGVDLGREGWWVAGYALNDQTWERIKSGDLAALSIGGTGVLEDVT